MSVRWVKLKLMKQKSIIMFLQQLNLNLTISKILHTMQIRITQPKNSHESMRRFSHHKHWEILMVNFVRFYNEFQDCVEGVLILFVGYGSVGVAGDVDAVYLF